MNQIKTDQELVDTLSQLIENGELKSAQEADEEVVELLAQSGHEFQSAEYLALSDRLCEISGKSFPGEWARDSN